MFCVFDKISTKVLVELKLICSLNDDIIKRLSLPGYNSNEIAGFFCVKITAGFI